MTAQGGAWRGPCGAGIAAAVLASALAGCLWDRGMAGGDDYPNSVQPLGRHAAGEMRDTSEWNAYRDAPPEAPGVYDSILVPVDPPAAVPAKAAVGLPVPPGLDVGLGVELPGAQRSLVSTVDPGTGMVRSVRVQQVPATSSTGSLRVEDTTWFLPQSDGALLVRVSGRVEHGGARRYLVFEDGDGDGILSARAGSANVALVRITTISAQGEREETEMRTQAGPDRDFNDPQDNALLALRKVVTRGLDTLSSLVLRDADGDGLIYNPLRDSNLVDVESLEQSQGGTRTEIFYRVTVFPEPARNYAHRFRRIVSSSTRRVETRALGRDSLPDFRPGDSGWVSISYVSTGADSLASAEFRYRVLLSETGNPLRHQLLKAERWKSFRAGEVAHLYYSVEPGAPVPDGSYPRTGSLRIRADFAAGGWIEFDGRAFDESILGVYLDSLGRSGQVRFDTVGRPRAASSSPQSSGHGNL